MVWEKCLESLKTDVSEEVYKEYFAGLKLVESNDLRIVIEVPESKDAKAIATIWKGLIENAYQKVTGTSTDFEFRYARPARNNSYGNINNRNYSESRLSQDWTFDTFVVGEKSRFAYSAAMAVAESPGENKYNPLLIYGGSGLGKTHLMQAIGNYAEQQDPKHRVHYITAEKFTNEFVTAIREKKMPSFAAFYRNNIDLLLIDDIQFLDKKIETQNEFFHIFNTLHEAGKQIVMTSDSPPSDLKGLEERLISRCQWGLLVDVQPPDVETRAAILESKAVAAHLEIDDEIIHYIANNVDGNIRQLEGAISQLALLTSTKKEDISMNLAREVVETLKPTYTKQISKDAIISTVSSYFEVEEDKLLESKRGTKEVAQARQVTMYLMRKLTNLSHKSVGTRVGNRDHSTVVHAIRTIEKLCKEDNNFAKTIEHLKNKIQNS